MKSHPNYYKLMRISKTASLMALMILMEPRYAKKINEFVRELEAVIAKHNAANSFYHTKNLLKED